MNNTGRVQVRDLNGPESLQTAARPVNSMVEQAKPVTDNSFLQLGKALAEVRPGINAYLEDMQREEASTETEAGRLQAMKSNALGWKDAVDKGLVKPGASPWFIKGYKEQQGRTIGRQWEADAMSAYEQWDGKGSDDPAQFQKFMGDFLAKRIDGVDDADVRVGLMPEVQRLQNNMSQHHASYTADRIYNQAVEGMQAEIGQLVDKAHSDAIQYKQAVDLNGLSGTIRGMEDRWKFLGIKGRDINRALVDIVTTKAIESGNERLLDLLKTARPDGTPGAGTTTYGREKMAQASHTIFNRVLQAESRTHPVSAAVRQLSSSRGLPSSSRAGVRAGGFGGCR